ncbi:flavodoxin family protein [Clostridium felsineum]|uniref:flavodoxin family protein n=1 Tax=Clostridium felsineum TaxID=36839 RepID=UPI00098C054A|nr:flavodoxin family protein [Clostridium felsineum]URZ14738.1 2-amino-4-deoxychorismate dehydrogenase [Clostridium felsineum DSM 794]
MKVIGINGSSRKDGNTAILIEKVFEELKKQGVETELIQLFNKEIKSCKGCFACKGNKKCVIGNDDFNECFNKIVDADGIILGSPVYSADISSKMKAFIERAGVIVATNPGMLKYKVGASVVAVRRGGGMTAVDTLNHFLLNKEVIVVGSTYWNMAYGKDIGDVLDDEEGILNMKNLGQNMAYIIRKIRYTK